MKDFITRFLTLRQERKDVQEMLAEIEDEFQNTEVAIVENLQEAELDEVKATSGERIRLCPQKFATSVDGMDDLITALKGDADSAWLVRETVHMQTLSAWMREKLESGGLPEALKPHICINEIVQRLTLFLGAGTSRAFSLFSPLTKSLLKLKDGETKWSSCSATYEGSIG